MNVFIHGRREERRDGAPFVGGRLGMEASDTDAERLALPGGAKAPA